MAQSKIANLTAYLRNLLLMLPVKLISKIKTKLYLSQSKYQPNWDNLTQSINCSKNKMQKNYQSLLSTYSAKEKWQIYTRHKKMPNKDIEKYRSCQEGRNYRLFNRYLAVIQQVKQCVMDANLRAGQQTLLTITQSQSSPHPKNNPSRTPPQ